MAWSRDFKAAPERTVGTYSKYNSIDDKLDDLHYYTTFIKFGIGRATSARAHELRDGKISREEAVYLVKKYDGVGLKSITISSFPMPLYPTGTWSFIKAKRA